METVLSSLCRAKSMFSNEEKKGIFEYCKDADTRLSVWLLECENNKTFSMLSVTGLIADLTKRRKLQQSTEKSVTAVRLPENVTSEELQVHQYSIRIPLLSHSCHVHCPSHPPWLDHSNYTARRVRVILCMNQCTESVHVLEVFV
jgi:hypothetical protein